MGLFDRLLALLGIGGRKVCCVRVRAEHGGGATRPVPLFFVGAHTACHRPA